MTSKTNWDKADTNLPETYRPRKIQKAKQKPMLMKLLDVIKVRDSDELFIADSRQPIEEDGVEHLVEGGENTIHAGEVDRRMSALFPVSRKASIVNNEDPLSQVISATKRVSLMVGKEDQERAGSNSLSLISTLVFAQSQLMNMVENRRDSRRDSRRLSNAASQMGRKASVSQLFKRRTSVMNNDGDKKVQENSATIKEEGVDNVPGKATQALLMKKGPKKKQNLLAKNLWNIVRKNFDVFMVLKSDPETRDNDELVYLTKYLKTLPVFNIKNAEYREDSLFEIAKDITAADYKPNDVVFYENDPSDAFFIILQGEVNVVKFVLKDSKWGDGVTKRKSMAAFNFKRASVQNFFKQDIINTRGAGASFGQIGLLKNQPRGATVICKTECRVARVSKDCYIKVAKYQDQLQYKRRMDFFKNIDIFHSLKAEEISPLGYFGIDITFPKGKIILKEGGKILSIYIVKSGDVVHRRKGLQISILGTHGIIGDVTLIKPDQQKSSFKEGEFVALSEVEVVELNLHDLFSVLRLESQETISKSVLDKYRWHDTRYGQISATSNVLKTMQVHQGRKEKQLTIYDLLNTRNAAAAEEMQKLASPTAALLDSPQETQVWKGLVTKKDCYFLNNNSDTVYDDDDSTTTTTKEKEDENRAAEEPTAETPAASHQIKKMAPNPLSSPLKKRRMKAPPVTFFISTPNAMDSYTVPMVILEPSLMTSKHDTNLSKMKYQWKKAGITEPAKVMRLFLDENHNERVRIKKSFQLTAKSKQQSKIHLGKSGARGEAHSAVKEMLLRNNKSIDYEWADFRECINDGYLPSDKGKRRLEDKDDPSCLDESTLYGKDDEVEQNAMKFALLAAQTGGRRRQRNAPLPAAKE